MNASKLGAKLTTCSSSFCKSQRQIAEEGKELYKQELTKLAQKLTKKEISFGEFKSETKQMLKTLLMKPYNQSLAKCHIEKCHKDLLDGMKTITSQLEKDCESNASAHKECKPIVKKLKSISSKDQITLGDHNKFFQLLVSN